MINKIKLESLTLRDPLAFGISYVDLLEDKKWEVETRAWSKEIYATVNPWLIEKYPVNQPRRAVITKSTQAGISTAAIVKALHFATNWSVRIGYTLPRQQDTIDFVSTRFDPTISASNYLKEKLGMPDSLHAKRIGNSYIFFMEMSTEPRMMPIDALFVDEIDLSNPDNVASVLNRLDASRWKMVMYLSTPTISNYGIHGIYQTSDMRQWLVKCPVCGYEQPIDWEVNLRIVGAHNNPTKVFYGCAKCNSEITIPHMQTGRWVAEHPDLSTDLAGFHVHQMLTTPAPDLYKIFRDPQTKLIEFYRKRLGKPYELGGGSISRDDFLENCFEEPYEPELYHDGESDYYLGADQGNELQVIISKLPKNSTRPKVVHVELIPMEKGFERLAQLIRVFKIKRGVVDANPNRHAAVKLTEMFPGRIMVADYVEQKTLYKMTKQGKSYFTNMAIDRTMGFDTLTKEIKDGVWALPGQPPELTPDVELVIDHVTALKRDVEERRTSGGAVQVAVWKKIRADHLGHAWLYMMIALQSRKGRNNRIAIIGSENNKPEDVVVDENVPDTETLVAITAILAEVPKDQLIEFLDRFEDDDYVVPFPLSFKLKRAMETYKDEHIFYTIQALAGKLIPSLS